MLSSGHGCGIFAEAELAEDAIPRVYLMDGTFRGKASSWTELSAGRRAHGAPREAEGILMEVEFRGNPRGAESETRPGLLFRRLDFTPLPCRPSPHAIPRRDRAPCESILSDNSARRAPSSRCTLSDAGADSRERKGPRDSKGRGVHEGEVTALSGVDFFLPVAETQIL